MAGNRPSGSAPDSVKSSVWQMPVALISTSTSPARGPSSDTVSIDSGLPFSCATAARTSMAWSPPSEQKACAQLRLRVHRVRVAAFVAPLRAEAVDAQHFARDPEPGARAPVERKRQRVPELAHAALLAARHRMLDGAEPVVAERRTPRAALPRQQQIGRVEVRAAAEERARLDVGLAAHRLGAEAQVVDARVGAEAPEVGAPGEHGVLVLVARGRGRIAAVLVAHERD